jgi:hypothetical protein
MRPLNDRGDEGETKVCQLPALICAICLFHVFFASVFSKIPPLAVGKFNLSRFEEAAFRSHGKTGKESDS